MFGKKKENSSKELSESLLGKPDPSPTQVLANQTSKLVASALGSNTTAFFLAPVVASVAKTSTSSQTTTQSFTTSSGKNS